MFGRTLALFIDGLTGLFIGTLISAALEPFIRLDFSGYLFFHPFMGIISPGTPSIDVITLAVLVLYGALMEHSTFRATIGKLIVGSIVCKTDKNSRDLERVSFARGVWRNFLKWFSVFSTPLLLVSAFSVWSLSRRSLHEWLSQTRTFNRIKGQIRYRDESLRDTSLRPAATFEDHEQAGVYGETLLLKQLNDMKGRIINAYGSSGNIVFNDRNFEIDAYALVPGLGVVVMEAKYYSGNISLNDI